ncbi:MAG: glycerophosphodiester phosphodiesterase family protein [Lachnospira sp.]
MFKKIRNNYHLLFENAKNIVLFELVYKCVAIALIYPLILILLDNVMEMVGINYLTNEYIKRALTSPLVIAAIVAVLVLFVIFCTYEMAYMAVCFQTRRESDVASVMDILYNAFIRVKKRFSLTTIPLCLFYFVAISATNVTILINAIVSPTVRNLFMIYIWNNKTIIKVCLFACLFVIYSVVLLGIYTFNIYMLEGTGFMKSYRKSVRMVLAHPLGTVVNIVGYNLLVAVSIFLIYFIISIILIVGVKLLDMAYIGTAVYLSVLRGVRTFIKVFLMCIAIPMSFSVISNHYYQYADREDITFCFIDIDEGSARFNKIVYCLVLSVSVGVLLIYLVFAFNKSPFEKIAVFHETQITAHRGASAAAPENTMAAFSLAMNNLADSIELDVQLTKDGKIIVMHDSSAKRTTGTDRLISDMTLKEVKQLDAGSWFSEEFKGEKVPSLEEVLELVSGKINLNIEIKNTDRSDEMAEKLVELLHKYNMVNNVVVTSFDKDVLLKVKEREPGVQVGYILSVAYGNFYEIEGVDFFSMNASFLSKRVVEEIHNSGKQVHAWTVNSETSIRNLANMGVDAIITDEPVLARETIYSRDTSETFVNMLAYVFNN